MTDPVIPPTLQAVAAARIEELLIRARIDFAEAARHSLLSHNRATTAAHPQAIALDRERAGADELRRRAHLIWDTYDDIIDHAGIRSRVGILSVVLGRLEANLREEIVDIFTTNRQTLNGLDVSIGMEYLARASTSILADLRHDLALRGLEADARAGISLAALEAPRYASARASWDKSKQFQLMDDPDWENAVKEAVMAVEGLAKVALDLPGATLGDCLNDDRIRKALKPELVKLLHMLWGFAGNAPGVRHAGIAVPQTTAGEGRFAIDVAEAALQLLLSLDGPLLAPQSSNI